MVTLADEKQPRLINAAPAEFIDSSSAGDAFNGGFLDAWLKGRPVAIGRAPFLIAHALTDPGNRCGVTTEVFQAAPPASKSAYTRYLRRRWHPMVRHVRNVTRVAVLDPLARLISDHHANQRHQSVQLSSTFFGSEMLVLSLFNGRETGQTS